MSRWLPIVGGISLNLALGSLYAWSVFVLPLEKEFGWSRTQTSWVYTIAIVCFAASFIVAGKLQDKKGPQLCAFLGALLVGGGFALSSLTTSVGFLYVAFGVIVGVGNGFGYAAPTPVASKWFPDKRGLAVGLMVGGYGAGSAIIGPMATSLINDLGWRATFRILGAAFFVMGLIGTALLKNPPAGYTVAGAGTHTVVATGTASGKSLAYQLAAGIRLAHFGNKVCIFERHNAPGGLNGFYSLGGRKFDVGLHAMTNYVRPGVKGTPLTKLLRQLRIDREEFALCEQKRSRVAFGPSGVDEVEFLLTPHPSSGPRPLDRGASGGELSRVMLALEVVLAGTGTVPRHCDRSRKRKGGEEPVDAAGK